MTRTEALASMNTTLDELAQLAERERELYGQLIQAAQHVVGAELIEVKAGQQIADDAAARDVRKMQACLWSLKSE
jgi:hypothetical protein